MKWQVKIAARARRDIEEVLDFTLEQYGETQHEEYKDLINQAVNQIAKNPLLAPTRPRDDIHPDARVFYIARRGHHARHFLLYRMMANGIIDLGRLLHDTVDLKRHLPVRFRPPTDPEKPAADQE